MIETKWVSGMEKCFLDQTPADFPAIETLRLFPEERATAQLLVYDAEERWGGRQIRVELESELSPYIRLRTVESVPCARVGFGTNTYESGQKRGSAHLRTAPGLYPDVLCPLPHEGKLAFMNQLLYALQVDIDTPNVSPGRYDVRIRLFAAEECVGDRTLPVVILNGHLPERDTRFTQWFHVDCLAEYYHVPVWSDELFDICEAYIREALAGGINMILTPVFTPPLDTAIGKERLTVQLVDVRRTNGRYSFGFKKLDRWIDILERCGVKYIEISHLFTQWGAYHAPKIIATVDGKEEKIFGWETDATGKEYTRFIRSFLKKLTKHLDARGLKERTYFHLSDEPQPEHIEQYRAAWESISDILSGWKHLDALSHVEYYHGGLCDIPVPCMDARIKPFLDEEPIERWLYYCGSPSLHLLSFPLSRLRTQGILMYRYRFCGFLQWAFNFYKNEGSEDNINPFLNTGAGYWTSGGTSYTVYPGTDRKPLASVRLQTFRMLMDDIRLMKLCEEKCGRAAVEEAIDACCGTIDFDHYVNDAKTFIKLRTVLEDMALK